MNKLVTILAEGVELPPGAHKIGLAFRVQGGAPAPPEHPRTDGAAVIAEMIAAIM